MVVPRQDNFMPHCLTSLSERRVKAAEPPDCRQHTCRSCLGRLHVKRDRETVRPQQGGLGPCRRVLEGPEQGGEQGEQLLDIWPRDLVR